MPATYSFDYTPTAKCAVGGIAHGSAQFRRLRANLADPVSVLRYQFRNLGNLGKEPSPVDLVATVTKLGAQTSVFEAVKYSTDNLSRLSRSSDLSVLSWEKGGVASSGCWVLKDRD